MSKENEDKKMDKAGEEDETGFTVKDKRKIGKEEDKSAESEVKDEAKSEEKESAKEAIVEPEEKKEAPPAEEEIKQDQELPPIDFMSFIMSLSTSALIYLGEVPDPVDNERKKIIPMAKQMIDLISLLKEKTKGNLTADEEKYMENILFELRMLFVKASTK
jgi:hypothetical protein